MVKKESNMQTEPQEKSDSVKEQKKEETMGARLEFICTSFEDPFESLQK